MNLTKPNLRYLIKKVNKDLDDFNNNKLTMSPEQITELYMLKEELKAKFARVLMNKDERCTN